MRSLDGQIQDLSSIREHLGIVISAAGIAAAFLGGQAEGRGPGFWVAVAAFALIAILAVLVYRPVAFPSDFDGYKLVAEYVDPTPRAEADFVMRELAVHAADNHRANRQTLDRLWQLQSLAFLFFAAEVIALLTNMALEAK